MTGPAGKLLITFSFLPVILPTTVAASGLIGVWGQSGIISGMSQSVGLPGLPPIYGIGAVLLAHVFFNAPLMMRVLMGALSGIPAAHWRQSA
ncbi:MAG: thiamine/thiamine pyrophosphate ABC transporter permease ThiP, partial [Alphaproteobacteria bacterium]|nr:thiamine/thiamine pyrophosphate ABC transporter permease ThiP [Alphaproteobacteria bacterium]